jgi:hypothetical protein
MQRAIKYSNIPYLLLLTFMMSCSVHKEVCHGDNQLTQGQSIPKVGVGKLELEKTRIETINQENIAVLSAACTMDSSLLNKANSVVPLRAVSPDRNYNSTLNSAIINSKIPMSKVANQTEILNEDESKKSKRKSGITVGGSILLMAVLAGVSIPVLGTLTASLGLIGIFLLDVLVSIGLIKHHKTENPKLAQRTGILRLLYTAILGVATGFHIGGNVSLFNEIWGAGLIVFGLHLISLGLLFNPQGKKKWMKYLIKSLLILGGVGYIILEGGLLLVPAATAFAATVESIFIVPMILGELLYAFWMLFKGGKSVKK